MKKEAHEWTPGRLVTSIATSLTNDNQIELDFSPTIGHGKNKPRNPSDGNSYWLPAHLNQNTEIFRVKTIHPIFVNTCLSAGFKIHGDWIDREDCIMFKCTRSRYHNEDKNKKHAEGRTRDVKNASKPPLSRDNKTERPIKEEGEETCKFKFRVYWNEKRKRWFLPHQQRGVLQHCGHSHPQVDRHSNQVVGVGTGPCGTSVIGGSSSYQVLSQKMEYESQDDFALATSGSKGKRSSAYQDFMPLYQEASKLVDATGQEGHDIMRKCFQNAVIEMRQIAL
mmetsp:Transcript_29060/g.45729  ORF Transcript_29060/g.45729 Transcript_29060/m.45729 type:complete len:280 (-) Transcript_29060:136-975(-)